MWSWLPWPDCHWVTDFIILAMFHEISSQKHFLVCLQLAPHTNLLKWIIMYHQLESPYIEEDFAWMWKNYPSLAVNQRQKTCQHPFFLQHQEPQKQRFIPRRGFTTRVVNLYSFPTQATQSRLTTHPGDLEVEKFFGSGSFLVASFWWLMVANASLKTT